MSQAVDSKVVEMQFDNAQFERNVQTSLSTLDRLKRSLNFGESAKSLEVLGNSANRMNFSGFAGAIETVSMKFSALEIVAITALANITNTAVNAGKRLVSSLSIDNIAAGWAKFGEKTSSVATLTAQGYALEKVNEQLDKLNWFTDETSYNFTDMTSNIAKFTATGKDLESSVTAMQGIANWAALSGQNAMTASRAMYQLSQAMGAGVMRKEDYKSIQNASMDTQEFRQIALDTAVALGTLQKNADGTYRSIVEGVKAEDFEIGQFADHLTKELWFTGDVMMEVFKKYSSAVEPIYNFTEEYDLLASQVLEAKHAYDEGGDAFKNYVEKLDLSKEGEKDLKKLVKNLDDFGVKALEAAQQARTWADVIDSVKDAVSTGWMKTFELIFGNQEQATKLFTTMANELYDVFAEPINGLNELFEAGLGAESAAFSGVEDASDELTGRSILIQGFANIWRNLLDTMDLVPEAFRQVFPEMSAEQLYHMIEGFEKFTEKLKLSDETADKVSKTLYGFFSIVDIVTSAVREIGGPVITELVNGFGSLAGHVLNVTSGFGLFAGDVDESIKKSEMFSKIGAKLAEIIRKIFGTIELVISKASHVVKGFVDILKEHFVTPGFEAFSKLLTVLGGGLEKAGELAGNFKNKIGGVVGSISSKLSSIGITAALEKLWGFIKAGGKAFLDAVGKSLTAIVDAIAHADFKGIIDFIGSLIGIGSGLGFMGVLKEIREFVSTLREGKIVKKENPITSLVDSLKDTLESIQDKLKPDKLRAIAISVAILAGSLFVLSKIDSDKIGGSLGAMAGILVELMGSMYAYTKIVGDQKISNVTGVMVGMALSVLILSSALKKISDIDTGSLWKSVGAIGVLMLELVAAMTILSMSKSRVSAGAIQMIAMAAAVKILASACKDLSTMDWDQMVRGLVGVGVLLGELTAFSLFAGEAKHIVATGIGMIAMASGIKILASAVKSFGTLSWEQIGKGLLTMGAALTEIALAVNLMPAGTLAIGPGLIAMSTAMLILSGVLKIMGGMEWEQIAKGLTALGGSMLILAVGANAMKGAIPGALAMVVMAGALAVIIPELVILGMMPIANISKALLSLAGAFAVFGVAGLALGAIAVPMAAAAGAMALMGAAVVLVGVGLVAAGAGIISMSAGLTALTAAISYGGPIIVSGITALLVGIVSLIPTVATALAKGVITFIKTLAEAAPDILKSLVKLVLTLCAGLRECVPDIAKTFLLLVLEAFDLMAEYAPQIADRAVKLLGGILTVIGSAISQIDLKGFADALIGIGAITAFMIGLGALVGLLPGAIAGTIGLGVLIAELGAVFTALGLLKQIPGVEWLINEGGDFAALIGTQLGKFIGSIFGGIAEGATSTLPAIGSSLSGFMEEASPFFDGVSSMGRDTFNAIGELALAIETITKAKLLDGIAGWVTGKSSIEEFSKSLPQLAIGLAAYSAIVSSASFNDEKIEASRSLVSMLAEFASKDVPRTGGLISLIAGDRNLGTFASQLAPLAEGLSSYAEKIDDTKFSKKKIKASEDLATMLATLASADIPATGGVLQMLKGEKDLSNFGSQLAPLAEGLSSYAEKIDETKFSEKKIQASTDLVRMLAGIASADIPKSGGFISWLEGENSLKNLGEQLPDLADGLTAYSQNLGDSVLDKRKIVGAKSLLNDLTEMSAGGLPVFNDTVLSTFKIQLPGLADALSAYSENLSDNVLDQRKISASIGLTRILAQLASADIPKSGGVLQFLSGSPDLSVFGGQLVTLATGICGYTNALAENESLLNSVSIDASTNLVSLLGTIASADIPATGGVLQMLKGDRDLSSFGRQLPALATGISEYAKNLSTDLNDGGKIEASNSVATMLASLSKDIPTSGGILGKLFGGDDLSNFAKQLPLLGEAIATFAKNLGDDISSTSTKNAKEISDMLIELQDAVSGQNNGGIFTSGDLEKFGQNIASFGQWLVAYSIHINSIDYGTVLMVSQKITESIAELCKTDTTKLSRFAKTLEDSSSQIQSASQKIGDSFGEGLANSINTSGMKESAESLSSSFIDAINNKSGSMIDAGSSLGKNIASGLKASTSGIPDELAKILATAVSKAKSKDKEFQNAGKYLAEKLLSGLKDKKDDIKDSFNSGLSRCVDKIREHRGSFYSAGSYLVDGFAKGISENTWKAEAKAKAMAEKAKTAAKKELNEKSPSKDFYKIGAYAGEGFVNALDDYASISYKSGRKMAVAAKDGLRAAVSKMPAYLDGTVEYQPTIRPVMDLGDIRIGAAEMDNLFARPYYVETIGSLNTVGSRIEARSQYSADADILSALNELRRSINGRQGDTYIVNGITYDDGSNISTAISSLIHAVRLEGRM